MTEPSDLGVFESHNKVEIPSAPPDPFYYDGLNLMGSTPGQLVPALEPQTEQYGKVRMDNCQETVLGTKIMADNVNIIVSNDKGTKLHQNIKKWGKDGNEENGLCAEDQKEPDCCWNRRVLYVVIGLAAILVVVLVIWLVSAHLSGKSGGGAVNPQPPATTTSTGRPITSITDPSPVSTRTIATSTQSPAVTTQGPSPSSVLVSRSEWKGKEPSRAYLRTYGYSVDHIALDSFGASHCATISACSAILQEAEQEIGGSLNYDFLIDDSGNTYEARGWDYLSDYPYNNDSYPKVLADQTVKVAFIGNYDNLPLTTLQIQGFISLIVHNEKVSDPTIETQAYRGIPGETGPSKNVYCDIQRDSALSVLRDPSQPSCS